MSGEMSGSNGDVLHDDTPIPTSLREEESPPEGIPARVFADGFRPRLVEEVKDLTALYNRLHGDHTRLAQRVARNHVDHMGAFARLSDDMRAGAQADASRQAFFADKLARAEAELAALGAQTGVVAAEASAARAALHTVPEMAKRLDDVEAAHKGWLATGRVAGKWALSQLPTAVAAVVAAVGGWLAHHFHLFH